MRLYHYNPESGEYLGDSIAVVDPAERDKIIQDAIDADPDADAIQVTIGHWIQPADTTPITPPTYNPETQTLNFMEGRWVITDKPTPPPPTVEDKKAEVRNNASVLLHDTLNPMMVYYEHNQKIPDDLVAYRDALRAIIADPKPDTKFPDKPKGL